MLLYTSEARAEEAMEEDQVPPNTYATARMDAPEMLEILGAMKLRAVVNRSCRTGNFTMSGGLAGELASGAALTPKSFPDEELEHAVLNVIEPADYPTDLIQPLFESLRRHREFRAAWVLRHPKPTEAGGKHYQILVLMDPRDQVVMHDLTLVLASVCRPPDALWCGLIDEKDRAYTGKLLQQATPFYRAVDFS